MNILLRLIVLCLDPLQIRRKQFVNPLVKIIRNVYDKYRKVTQENVNSIQDLLLRFGLLASAVALIIWTAVFIYAAFYYAYMPPILHSRPLYMQYRTCPQSSLPCTFPNAHVSLTHDHKQLLTIGQAYRVVVKINMPESKENLDLGMFMVCIEMHDRRSLLKAHACRSAMMRYRSPLIRKITTWVLSPFYILGLKEEYQEVAVEVFSQYLDTHKDPITDIYVEIKSQQIQFYAVSLHIIADFTGLRYIMYNRPVISAVVGISTILFFILIVFLLSWYHWSDTVWVYDLQDKYNRFATTLQESASTALLISKNSLQDDEFSFPDDDKSFNSDIEDIHNMEEEQARLHHKSF